MSGRGLCGHGIGGRGKSGRGHRSAWQYDVTLYIGSIQTTNR